MNMNGYRCVACAVAQTADYESFLCPVCGGNLDISYDYAAAAQGMRESFAKLRMTCFGLRHCCLCNSRVPLSPAGWRNTDVPGQACR